MKINRRKFLKYSLIATGGFFGSQLLSGCSVHSDREYFSFVQLNDTHINVLGNKAYPKSEEKLISVISSINSEKKFPLPDFVLFVGDIVQGNKLKFLLPDCEYSKKIIDELKCPYYTVVGNHEVLNSEGNPLFLNPYKRTFGNDRVNYSFIHKGIHFILFNNSNGLGSGSGSTAIRNEWLMNTLDDYPTHPKIIVCHIPLISYRENKILFSSFGYKSYKLRGESTWEIIKNHSSKVIAVLNGHVHMTGAKKTNDYWLSSLFFTDDNIFHISPSGLASYPCHYAYYQVFENRIDVRMLQVDQDLVTPASNIHGKFYHKTDFTDNLHKTHESYVSGNKDEQNFSIPLVKSKQPSI